MNVDVDIGVDVDKDMGVDVDADVNIYETVGKVMISLEKYDKTS